MGRILVVDDNRPVVDLLEEAFGREGHELIVVSSGYHGLGKLLAGGYDVVVSDVMMPGLYGTEMLLIALAFHKMPPAVLISGGFERAETTNEIAALCAQGVDYMTKPFDLIRLLNLVKEKLGG